MRARGEYQFEPGQKAKVMENMLAGHLLCIVIEFECLPTYSAIKSVSQMLCVNDHILQLIDCHLSCWWLAICCLDWA